MLKYPTVSLYFVINVVTQFHLDLYLDRSIFFLVIWIRYVITLSAVDQNKHLRALFHLLTLLKDPSFVEKLDRVQTAEEANKLIETSEYHLNDY